MVDVVDGLSDIQHRIIHSIQAIGGHQKEVRCSKVLQKVFGHRPPELESYLWEKANKPPETIKPYLEAYLSLVGMVQPFQTRYPLIAGTGNFGTIDGDPPSDHVFNSCQLAALGLETITGLQPNLLVNGAIENRSGKNIFFLAHNFAEIMNAAISCTTDHLQSDNAIMEMIPGPDLPTGGVIRTPQSLKDIYREGSGDLSVFAKSRIDTTGYKKKLIVTEIPYLVTKTEILDEIHTCLQNGKISGIEDIYDESESFMDIRLIFLLHPDTNVVRLEQQLCNNTSYQTTLQVNMLVSDNDNLHRISLSDQIRGYAARFREHIMKETNIKDENELKETIIGRMDDLRSTFSDPRRTLIGNHEIG